MREGEGRRGRKGSPQNIPRGPQPASSGIHWSASICSRSAVREFERAGIQLERKTATVGLGKDLVASL